MLSEQNNNTKATSTTTSTSTSTATMQPLPLPNQRTTAEDLLSDEQLRNHITHTITSKEQAANFLFFLECNPAILHEAHNSIILNLLCTIYKPFWGDSTLTVFYEKLTEILFATTKIPCDICCLAYLSLQQGMTSINLKDKQICLSGCQETITKMQKTGLIYLTLGGTIKFIHENFQAFLAAQHMTALIINNDPHVLTFIQNEKYNPPCQQAMCFAAGMLYQHWLQSNDEFPLIKFFDAIQQFPRDLLGTHHAALLIRLMEECQCDEKLAIYEQLLQDVTPWVKLEIRHPIPLWYITNHEIIISPIMRALSVCLKMSKRQDTLIPFFRLRFISFERPYNSALVCSDSGKSDNKEKLYVSPEILPSDVEALISVLFTSLGGDSDVCDKQIALIGDKKKQEIIEKLLGYLEKVGSNLNYISSQAAIILGKLGRTTASTSRIACQLCRILSLNRDNGLFTMYVIQALNFLGYESTSVTATLCSCAHGKYLSPCLEVLEKLGKSDLAMDRIAIPIIHSQVVDSNDCTVANLQNIINFLGRQSKNYPQALKTLIMVLSSDYKFLRDMAENNLQLLVQKDNQIAEQIFALGNSLNSNTSRLCFVKVLGLFGANTTKTSAIINYLCEALHDKDESICCEAITSLEKLCKDIPGMKTLSKDAPEIIHKLLPFLNYHNKDVCYATISTLITLGDNSPQLIDKLRLGLKGSYQGDRIKTVQSIIRLRGNEKLQLLFLALQDKDEEVREAAAIGLMQGGIIKDETIFVLCPFPKSKILPDEMKALREGCKQNNLPTTLLDAHCNKTSPGFANLIFSLELKQAITSGKLTTIKSIPQSITTLNLNNIKLSLEDWEYLFQLVFNHPNITKLDLSNCELSDEVGAYLRKLLAENHKITAISLEGNHLSQKWCKHIEILLQINAGKTPKLPVINICSNLSWINDQKILICPIHLCLPQKPVVLEGDFTGNNYDNDALVQWTTFHHTNPLTRQKIPKITIIPNLLLEKVITVLKTNQPDLQKLALIIPLLCVNGKLMIDPLILENGTTQDRQFIVGNQTTTPNKAIKDLNEELIKRYPILQQNLAFFAQLISFLEALEKVDVPVMAKLLAENPQLLLAALDEKQPIVLQLIHHPNPALLQLTMQYIGENFWLLPEVKIDGGISLLLSSQSLDHANLLCKYLELQPIDLQKLLYDSIKRGDMHAVSICLKLSSADQSPFGQVMMTAADLALAKLKENPNENYLKIAQLFFNPQQLLEKILNLSNAQQSGILLKMILSIKELQNLSAQALANNDQKLLACCKFAGIDLNTRVNGRPLWFLALEFGHIELLKNLIAEKFINLELTDEIGNTALHTAVKNGKIEVIKFLLLNPIPKFFEINAQHETLLNIAINVLTQHPDALLIVELIGHAMKINPSQLVIMLAIQITKYPAYNQFLESLVKKISYEDQIMVITDLMQWQNSDKARELLNKIYALEDKYGLLIELTKSAEINQLTSIIKFILQPSEIIALLETGNHKLIYASIAAGLNINTSFHGAIPWFIAVENHNIELITELLSREQLDINAIDKEGNTALHIAVIRKDAEMVKFLLQCGLAKFVKTPNKCGKTPLHLVEQDKDLSEIMLLAYRKDKLQPILKPYQQNIVAADKKILDLQAQLTEQAALHAKEMEAIALARKLEIEQTKTDPLDLKNFNPHSVITILCTKPLLKKLSLPNMNASNLVPSNFVSCCPSNSSIFLVLKNGWLCAEKNKIKYWDSNGNVVNFEGHAKPIIAMVLLPNGNVVSASEDEIRIWDIHKRKYEQGPQLKKITAISQDGNNLFVACDKNLFICNLDGTNNEPKLIGTLPKNSTVAVTTLPCGRRIAVGNDKEICLFDPSSSFSSILIGHHKKVIALATIGNLLASASEDGTIRLWNLARQECVQKYKLATQVKNLTISENGSLIAVDQNGKSYEWTLPTTKIDLRFRMHLQSGQITCAIENDRLVLRMPFQAKDQELAEQFRTNTEAFLQAVFPKDFIKIDLILERDSYNLIINDISQPASLNAIKECLAALSQPSPMISAGMFGMGITAPATTTTSNSSTTTCQKI